MDGTPLAGRHGIAFIGSEGWRVTFQERWNDRRPGGATSNDRRLPAPSDGCPARGGENRLSASHSVADRRSERPWTGTCSEVGRRWRCAAIVDDHHSTASRCYLTPAAAPIAGHGETVRRSCVQTITGYEKAWQYPIAPHASRSWESIIPGVLSQATGVRVRIGACEANRPAFLLQPRRDRSRSPANHPDSGRGTRPREPGRVDRDRDRAQTIDETRLPTASRWSSCSSVRSAAALADSARGRFRVYLALVSGQCARRSWMRRFCAFDPHLLIGDNEPPVLQGELAGR